MKRTYFNKEPSLYYTDLLIKLRYEDSLTLAIISHNIYSLMEPSALLL